MKKLAWLLLISISLTSCKSCKKNTKTTVSGLIVDSVTGNPIANAKVFLGQLESGTYGITAATVDETTSDDYGRYNFDFDAIKNKDYAIIAKAEHYFETESVSDYQLEEGKKNESFNIQLKPKAVIKIHVKKIDMSYDYLSLTTNTDESGSSGGAFGYNVDTNIIYINQKGGIPKDIYIYIEKYNSGVRISQDYDTLKNVYLIPIDTTYINLNY